MKNIKIIHPQDGDLKFLQKAIDKLNDQENINVHSLKLDRGEISHENAIEEIKESNNDELICFFCHGRSNGIYGCKISSAGGINQRYVLTINDGLLIHSGNISLLGNKKIFCLACKSNGIGPSALQNGAKVFIGFDEINFDLVLNDEHFQRIQVEEKTKYILRNCVFNALNQGLRNNWTFYQFYNFLKISLDKYSDNIVLNNKRILENKERKFFDFLDNKKCTPHTFHKYYKNTALCLQEIKNGMKLWGDGSLLLTNSSL